MSEKKSHISRDEKISALVDAFSYRPLLTVLVFGLSVLAAILEGIGISFILPIIELTRGQGGDAGGMAEVFVTLFQFVGAPFTLESVIIGVSVVLFVRYTTSILVALLREKIRRNYKRHLQDQIFDRALEAKIEILDDEGSERVMDSIVTQADYASKTIQHFVKIFQMVALSVTYVGLAFFFSPALTLFTIVVMGSITIAIRWAIESGYVIGDRVATAQEEIQSIAQSGTQGIHDVKLFNLQDYLTEKFSHSTRDLARDSIKVNVNRSLINNIYQMSMSIFIFVLIYVAVTMTSLTLGSLGVFLFALFRLAPRLSGLQDKIYSVESDLPHLVTTLDLIRELDDASESGGGSEHLVEDVDRVSFDDVSFSYEEENEVLSELSFAAERGEFVAFVGQSGAGKSTIVALLVGLYTPDSGQITANGDPIPSFDLKDWRSQVTVVRQSPYIFNDTLRHNIMVGNRDASQDAFEEACQRARVTEFLDDLPQGYESALGEDGAQLSGGQKQRIALARALLKDAEVLVLDEATSDLDSQIQSEIQAEIDELRDEYITIAISHRLSTVQEADRIYILENGEITAEGDHTHLLQKGGMYSDLYSYQTAE